MLSLPEVIITAFKTLGGEREIREIREWIYANYEEEWSDISTTMADMVPVSQGGNKSSRIRDEYRVLKRVSRGRYCLLESNSNRVNLQVSKSDNKQPVKVIQNAYRNPKEKLNYYTKSSNDAVEIYSLKRLPFEPKGWLLELRNTIKKHLKLLSSNGTNLYALYNSMDSTFFDLENVLFYNVGAAPFRHLNIKSLLFERGYQQPSIINGNQFEHYQLYQIIKGDNEITSNYWEKKRTLATWENVLIPKLTSEVKPHFIWKAMKRGTIKVKNGGTSTFYGMEVNIKTPLHANINLVSVIKPLIDGIISAFHYHDSSNIDEVVFRLKPLINLPTKEIKQLLLTKNNCVLGARNLIQPYRKGVKWNPADDAFQIFKISIESQQKNVDWAIDGEIFSISYKK